MTAVSSSSAASSSFGNDNSSEFIKNSVKTINQSKPNNNISYVVRGERGVDKLSLQDGKGADGDTGSSGNESGDKDDYWTG